MNRRQLRLGASVAIASLAISPALTLADSRADAAGLEAIHHCIAILDPIADIGYERVAARCPELPSAIDAASWSALLPPNWRARSAALSRDGLKALAALVAERDTARPMRTAPDLQQVQATLAEVGAIVDDRASRWERFKRWLRSVFARTQQDEREGMLRRVFGPIDIGETISRALAYVGYALLIAFAALVVLQELRAAGWIGRRRATPRVSADATVRALAPLSLGDIAAAPLLDRPGLYLKLLSVIWHERHGSEPTAAMTASEFGAILRAALPDATPDIRAIVHTADAVRYGTQAIPQGELEAAARGGHSLLALLAASPPDATERRQP